MFELQINRGYITIIDDEDRELVSSRRWCPLIDRHGFVYAMTHCLKSDMPKKGTIYLHRMLVNPPAGMLVDHINGNTLDNRRCNLRICTPAQNTRNRKPHVGGTSRFKGVSFFSPSGKWKAAIWAKRSIYGGLFETEEEAARRYDELARIHHGEFARLNFPD